MIYSMAKARRVGQIQPSLKVYTQKGERMVKESTSMLTGLSMMEIGMTT
jgi:hypothetical protein